MNARHKWTKTDYFRSRCDRCGCLRERQAGAFSFYVLDGQRYDYAPECDGRLLQPEPEQFVFNFLEQKNARRV